MTMVFASCWNARWIGSAVRWLALTAVSATTSLLLLTGPVAAATIVAISPVGLGLGGANTDVLQIQTSPFSVTTIGTAGVPALSGLAIQPSTGTLFASSGFGGEHPGSLFTLDPHTGAAMFIGQAGFGTPMPGLTALAFDKDGTLFGSSGVVTTAVGPTAGTTLITINPSTGVGSAVGPFGTGIDNMAALAIDPTTGTLFGGGAETPATPGVLTNLFTIDKKTGAATLLGTLSVDLPGAVLTGLTFDSTGHLFGSLAIAGPNSPAGPGEIGSIDIATRQFTPLGQTAGAISDIAVAVPEPSGVVLACTGALVLLGFVWRRTSTE
jgi:hypothetical protein